MNNGEQFLTFSAFWIDLKDTMISFKNSSLISHMLLKALTDSEIYENKNIRFLGI